MTDIISEIVQIAEVRKSLYLLVVEYEDGDGGNGVGHVQRTDGSRQPVMEGVLSTNDTQRAMWASPAGNLWLSSEGGNVWTTAKVRWPGPTDPELDHQSFDPSLKWSVTTLPAAEGEDHPPTLGAIWGTDDANVYVAGSSGSIHRWDGKAWQQVHAGAGSIMSFGGTSSDDVWAVGEAATILRFDGRSWTLLASSDPRDDELFMDVVHAADGSVYICSKDGRLLHGGASGLVPIHDDEDMQLMSLAFLGKDLYLAAGAKGVAQLKGSSVVVVRETFHAISVTPGTKRLFFLDASSDTTYVEFKPTDKQLPWGRITF